MKLRDMKQTAKLLNAKPNLLRDSLVKNGIWKVDRCTKQKLPTLEFIERGYFRIEETEYHVGPVARTSFKPMVTQLGIEFLREFIEEHKVPKAA